MMVARAPGIHNRRTPGNARTILVVEDDSAVAGLVKALIDDEPNWRAVVARDAFEARHLLSTRRLDAVLLDVNLPGMSGLEFLNRMRQNPNWVQPPVIVMSANVTRASVGKSLGDDAYCDFLPKPFDIEELLGTLDRVLNQPDQAKSPAPVSAASGVAAAEAMATGSSAVPTSSSAS